LQKKTAVVIGVFAVIIAGLAAIDIPIYLNSVNGAQNSGDTPQNTAIPTASAPTLTPIPITPTSPTTQPTTPPTQTPSPTAQPTPTPEPLDNSKFYFQATTKPKDIPAETIELSSDALGQNPLTYVNWENMFVGQTKKIGAADPAVYIWNKGSAPIYYKVSVTNLPSWATVVCHAQLNTYGLYNETLNILNTDQLIYIAPGRKAGLEFLLTISTDAPDNRGWIANLTVEGYASAANPLIPPYP
jgi:hypothetical protein